MAGAPPPPPPVTGWQQPVAPLQPDWTEHIGPQGQLYWHNAVLKQSTYYRPSVGALIPSSNGAPTYAGPPPTDVAMEPVSVKKEKPARKEPIPNAEGWLQVTTTTGNVFYAHPTTKRSEWTVPEEIRTHVEAMQAEERRARKEKKRIEREEQERLEQERIKEAKQRAEELRQKAEEEKRQRQEARRRKEEELQRAQEARAKVQQDRLRIVQEASKRKREGQAEANGDGEAAKESDKRARIDEDELEEDEDEEAWQRRMAAEMAAEAQGNTHQAPSSCKQAHVSTADLHITPEQSKEVFMHMLTTLNGTADEVNPMMPWDRELIKFVNHRDYTVIAALGDRQDAFNEWCKARLREKRALVAAAKASSSAGTAVSRTSSATAKATATTSEDGLASYQQLLEDEVKSTRTKWTDFRKEWKRDRRFFGFGRDDRERETHFRAWLKTLGERKRKVAEAADEAFIALLCEYLTEEHRLSASVTKDEAQQAWTKYKKVPDLEQDPRYDAVGSSSRRAELFEEWAKGKRTSANGNPSAARHDRTAESTTSTSRDAQSALRARQEQVRREQRQVEMEKNRSFGQALHEQSTTQFQQLLLDAVRDPLAHLSDTFAGLARDERFRAPGLEDREREDLFYEHIEKLNERRLRGLQDVFARHAPTLDIDAEHAVPLIKDDDEVALKQLDQLHSLVRRGKTVTDLFEEWRAQREQEAKEAFVQMLRENAFVEFWGRLRQEFEQRKAEGSDGKEDVLDAAEAGEEEDADVPSLLQMAAQIDLEEVHAVLQHDQRYRAFQHKPQERQRWIRDYLQTMRIPKKTVFQKT